MTPSVTISIPAYKEIFLAESIRSALEQDYPILELIIVDDCSPERVKEIVDSFHDPRIRYYRNEQNLGKKSIALNWNKCLEYAKGDYFVLLCDDDLLGKSFVSGLVFLAEKYPSCDVMRARMRLINSENNSVIGETPEWPEWESFPDYAIHFSAGERHHTISEFLIRTRTMREKGGYVPFPAGYYSDSASILRFSDNRGVCSSAECLAIYRKNSGCISSRDDYNYDKSRAALCFYKWLADEYPGYVDKCIIDNMVDYDLCSYFMGASWQDSFRIAKLVPSSVWTIKQKLALLRKKFFDNAK